MRHAGHWSTGRRRSYVDYLFEVLSRDSARVVLVHRDRAITAQEVRDTVVRYIRALRLLGVHRGDYVAALTGHRPEALVLQLAVHGLGCRYLAVPAGAADLGLLAETAPSVLVVDPTLDRLPDTDHPARRRIPTVLSLGPAPAATDLSALAAQQRARPPVDLALDPTGVSVVFPTGPASNHRLVLHGHRYYGSLVALSALRAGQGQPERLLVGASLAGCGSQAAVLLTLLGGGCIVLPDGFEPDEILDLVEQAGVTSLLLQTSLLDRLLDHPRLPGCDLSRLTVTCEGAPVPPARLAEAVARFGSGFSQVYGRPEAAIVTVLSAAGGAPVEDRWLRSVGRPPFGVDVTIQDDQGGHLPAGATGEVCVKGLLVMSEYLDRPDLTRDALRGGWLRTGDLGSLDSDGYLYLAGRSVGAGDTGAVRAS